MREERGELACGFAAGAGDERNKFAVKPGFANEQVRGNRDAHPAILEDVDGQSRAAGSEITVTGRAVSSIRGPARPARLAAKRNWAAASWAEVNMAWRPGRGRRRSSPARVDILA